MINRASKDRKKLLTISVLHIEKHDTAQKIVILIPNILSHIQNIKNNPNFHRPLSLSNHHPCYCFEERLKPAFSSLVTFFLVHFYWSFLLLVKL